jgi:hypothetical protein
LRKTDTKRAALLGIWNDPEAPCGAQRLSLAFPSTWKSDPRVRTSTPEGPKHRRRFPSVDRRKAQATSPQPRGNPTFAQAGDSIIAGTLLAEPAHFARYERLIEGSFTRAMSIRMTLHITRPRSSAACNLPSLCRLSRALRNGPTHARRGFTRVPHRSRRRPGVRRSIANGSRGPVSATARPRAGPFAQNTPPITPPPESA